MEKDRVSRLMICGDPPFFIRDNPALLLRTDSHLDKSMADILLLNKHPVRLCCQDRGFI